MEIKAQTRKIIETRRPEPGRVFLFWLIVVVLPLLAGRAIFFLYLENNLTQVKARAEQMLNEDIESFEKFMRVDSFVENQILAIEKELGLPSVIESENSYERSGAAKDRSISAPDFSEKLKSRFMKRLGVEPLLFITSSGKKSVFKKWSGPVGEKFTGFVGNAAARILMKSFSKISEKTGDEANLPAIFWQILRSVTGSDFDYSLKPRRLSSSFSFKKGGRRLFLYFNFFGLPDRKEHDVSGYLIAFSEDQIDQKKHFQWARSFQRNPTVFRRVLVKPAGFRMLNSFAHGTMRVYRPLALRSLRTGSHAGKSILDRALESGFLFERPARYFFLTVTCDLSEKIIEMQRLKTLVGLVFLFILFSSIYLLRRFCFEGKVALRISTKLFFAIFTAAILPMLLFFVLTGRYFDFYQKLIISNSQESLKQHLQFLELNIRNKEQGRYRELERFKDRLNLVVDQNSDQVSEMLETEFEKLYHGYYLCRSDGLILENVSKPGEMTLRDRRRLKMVAEMFKAQCFRVFKELKILGGTDYEKFRQTPTGRQILGMGEFFSPIDVDFFCLQDGSYFQTEKAEKGVFKFITFNLLPEGKRKSKIWAFVGLLQNIEMITSDFLESHDSSWRFFFRREGNDLQRTALFKAEKQKDGSYIIGDAWPRNYSEDPEFIKAAHKIDSTHPEYSRVVWQTVPRIYAARKLDKIPFIAVSQVDVASAGNEKGFLPVLLLLLLLYFIVLVLIISWTISDTFLKPLQALLGGTDQVNAGLFPQIDYKSDLELARVVGRFNQMIVGLLERQKLERFVSSEAARTIEKEILNLEDHQGERLLAAILFMHINAFEELCEKLEPEQLIAGLNVYFAAMEPLIQKNHGVIDKYIGDAIMVVFSENDAEEGSCCEHACKAAIAMLEEKENLSGSMLEHGFADFSIGIGIAFGEVIRGKIGASGGRKDFTVIGDVVNLAARLESISRKSSPAAIMVSDEVPGHCGRGFTFVRFGETAIKGKLENQTVFKLAGVGDE